MKIYQLHEYSGEWEDFRDYIVGSYVNVERAKAEMAKLQEKAKEKTQQSRICNGCPICDSFGRDDFEVLAQECSNYCKRFERENCEDGSIDCANWTSCYDEPSFEIKEVDVEEQENQ